MIEDAWELVERLESNDDIFNLRRRKLRERERERIRGAKGRSAAEAEDSINGGQNHGSQVVA